MVGQRINVITGSGREMVETVDTKNVTFCRKGGQDKQIRRIEARGLQPRVAKVSLVSVLSSLWSLLLCVEYIMSYPYHTFYLGYGNCTLFNNLLIGKKIQFSGRKSVLLGREISILI